MLNFLDTGNMQDRAYFLHHLLYISQISRTCNGNYIGNVLCPDLKSDISFYASAGNLAFLPVSLNFPAQEPFPPPTKDVIKFSSVSKTWILLLYVSQTYNLFCLFSMHRAGAIELHWSTPHSWGHPITLQNGHLL